MIIYYDLYQISNHLYTIFLLLSSSNVGTWYVYSAYSAYYFKVLSHEAYSVPDPYSKGSGTTLIFGLLQHRHFHFCGTWSIGVKIVMLEENQR